MICLRNRRSVLLLLCLVMIPFTGQAQKFGTIKVRKNTGGFGRGGVDEVLKPDTFYKSLRITASYRYFLIDTITSFSPENKPDKNSCVPCWPKAEIATEEVDQRLKSTEVSFPYVRLGERLLKNMMDTISVAGFDSTIKFPTIDTLEVGYIIDNDGRLYDFIFPIAKTNNNPFLLEMIFIELNRMNRQPANFNTAIANKGYFHLGKKTVKKKRFTWLRRIKKDKADAAKDNANFYCYTKFIVVNSLTDPTSEDYRIADGIENCESKLNDKVYKNVVENAKSMIEPFLNPK